MTYFRANVLFRNFEVKGGADRTLIYLTLHVVQCLVKCERIEDKNSALRELRALSTKQFAIPGDPAGWPLGGMFPTPTSKAEGDSLRAYLKQAREETCIRLCDRLFDADGTKNKWWQVRSASCSAQKKARIANLPLRSLSYHSSLQTVIFEEAIHGQGAEGLGLNKKSSGSNFPPLRMHGRTIN